MAWLLFHGDALVLLMHLVCDTASLASSLGRRARSFALVGFLGGFDHPATSAQSAMSELLLDLAKDLYG